MLQPLIRKVCNLRKYSLCRLCRLCNRPQPKDVYSHTVPGEEDFAQCRSDHSIVSFVLGPVLFSLPLLGLFLTLFTRI